MQHENSTATQSLSNLTTDGKIPQKVKLKMKTLTLGKGVMQTAEADRLNQELEAIATTASKESLAALQRSRGRLDQTLQALQGVRSIIRQVWGSKLNAVAEEASTS
jgi:uncharacterized protein YicC (UPF0701 family)